MKITKKKGKLTINKNSNGSVTSLSLPTTKKLPCENFFDYIMLIFGEKKIGKTSLLSCLADGNALFLMTESGTKALSVYERQIGSWKEFKEYVKLLKNDKKFPLVVIDVIDKLFFMCEKYICEKLVISHLSEEEWGKGYQAVREEFVKEMDALAATGKGIAFVSHAADKKIKTRVGDEYQLITNTMSKAARETIEGMVDVWAYYRYEGRDRLLTIRGDDHIGAGHRIKNHFRYTDGSRIRSINMGKSEEEGAKNLILAFENKLVNPKKEGKKETKSVQLKKKI